jgi:hypothetical protein
MPNRGRPPFCNKTLEMELLSCQRDPERITPETDEPASDLGPEQEVSLSSEAHGGALAQERISPKTGGRPYHACDMISLFW